MRIGTEGVSVFTIVSVDEDAQFRNHRIHRRPHPASISFLRSWPISCRTPDDTASQSKLDPPPAQVCSSGRVVLPGQMSFGMSGSATAPELDGRGLIRRPECRMLYREQSRTLYRVSDRSVGRAHVR